MSWLLLYLSVVSDVQPSTFNEVRALLLQSSVVRLVLLDTSSVFKLLLPVMVRLVNRLWLQLSV